MGLGKADGSSDQETLLILFHLNCKKIFLSSGEFFCFCLIYRVESYIPSVCSYHLSDLLTDLLDFAARFLVLDGRLVYWLPVIRDE